MSRAYVCDIDEDAATALLAVYGGVKRGMMMIVEGKGKKRTHNALLYCVLTIMMIFMGMSV